MSVAWAFHLLICLLVGSEKATSLSNSRRAFLLTTSASRFLVALDPQQSVASDTNVAPLVSVTGDAKKFFNEGRALDSQGNLAAAQRIYQKVTKIAPNFIYGWSNLGNTQTAFGDLTSAEESYTKAISLCQENLMTTTQDSFAPRCNDLYVILLNRGCLYLNNGMPKEALSDLQQSAALRARPDAIVLQNLARAEEMNGFYLQADRDYTSAIAMTSNEVAPFWLRSAMVKYQTDHVQEGFDLLKRVANRFPEAPEVRAAYAVFLTTAKGDAVAGQQKFLEIPNKQRLKYSDAMYLSVTLAWPPKMAEMIGKIAKAVGDAK
jgi:tetratricopeptide (TPR) repeat protein